MAVFSDLTVAENMVLAARDGPLQAARLDWVFSFFPALKRFWTQPAGTLSGGQKQMLSIARAVIEPRRLILIDEPTKGIAPVIIEDMIRAFRELKRERTTILLVEQNFRFAEALGDWAVVMDDGRIVHRASMAELAGDHRDAAAFVGIVVGGSRMTAASPGPLLARPTASFARPTAQRPRRHGDRRHGAWQC